MNISNIKGLEHIGIPTMDMEKSIAFYEKLGFRVILESLPPHTELRMDFMQKENCVIEFYEVKESAMAYGAIDHLCFTVEDVDALYKEIKEEGYEIVSEMEELPLWENGVRFFKIAGPNREILEFSQAL